VKEVSINLVFDEPASVPIVIFSGYFLFLNSGTDILPTVVSVAAEDPETAAKKVTANNISM
jgi:hypothetical protein